MVIDEIIKFTHEFLEKVSCFFLTTKYFIGETTETVQSLRDTKTDLTKTFQAQFKLLRT